MSAKKIVFDEDARKRLARGCRHSGRRGEGDAGTQGSPRRAEQELGRADRHERRCIGREGNRTEGQVRKHGRATGEAGCEQNIGRSRRRHHDGDGHRASRSA